MLKADFILKKPLTNIPIYHVITMLYHMYLVRDNTSLLYSFFGVHYLKCISLIFSSGGHIFKLHHETELLYLIDCPIAFRKHNRSFYQFDLNLQILNSLNLLNLFMHLLTSGVHS